MEKWLEVIESFRKLNFQIDWTELRLKIWFLRKFRTKEIGQGKKSFITTFACFLTAIAKGFLNGDWAVGQGYTQIWDFSNIS